jgi:hypothetical protein
VLRQEREDRVGTVRADELVLQVGVADEDLVVGNPGAAEHVALARVAEPGHARVRKPVDKAADGVRAPHRENRGPCRRDVDAALSGERLERDLVAQAFDENHGSRFAQAVERPSRRGRPSGRDRLSTSGHAPRVLVRVSHGRSPNDLPEV